MKSDPRYKDLLQQLCRIYEDTVLHNEKIFSRDTAQSYLRMGHEIVQFIETAHQGSGYGTEVIKQVSNDMTQRYGKGLRSRTIRYMRNFAVHYQNRQLSESLSWSHYCILLSIRDPKLRRAFEEQAIREKLGRDELQRLVSLHKHAARQKKHNAFPLEPRHGQPNIYKIIIPFPGTAPLLDAGFGFSFNPDRPYLSNLPHGTHVQRQSNGRYLEISCTKGARYCYRGKILRVIDGDTVHAQIHIAPGMYISESLRLRGVDAMELHTPQGKTARQTLIKMLRGTGTLTIHTYGSDRYGRYVADLVTDEDCYINKQLVESHVVRYLPMRTT